MKEQARDSKGNYLYKFEVMAKNVSFKLVIHRKTPIKRFSKVLQNLIIKNGYQWSYDKASLSILEKWEHEKMKPERNIEA